MRFAEPLADIPPLFNNKVQSLSDNVELRSNLRTRPPFRLVTPVHNSTASQENPAHQDPSSPAKDPAVAPVCDSAVSSDPTPPSQGPRLTLLVLGSSHVRHLETAWGAREFESSQGLVNVKFHHESGATFDTYSAKMIIDIICEHQPDLVITILGGNAIGVTKRASMVTPPHEVIGQARRFFNDLKRTLGDDKQIIAGTIFMRKPQARLGRRAPTSDEYRLVRDQVNQYLPSLAAITTIMRLDREGDESNLDDVNLLERRGLLHLNNLGLDKLKDIIIHTCQNVIMALDFEKRMQEDARKRKAFTQRSKYNTRR